MSGRHTPTHRVRQVKNLVRQLKIRQIVRQVALTLLQENLTIVRPQNLTIGALVIPVYIGSIVNIHSGLSVPWSLKQIGRTQLNHIAKALKYIRSKITQVQDFAWIITKRKI